LPSGTGEATITPRTRGKEPVALEKAYEAGHISFELHGQKLRGRFTLLRTHNSPNWLLVKQHDDEAREGYDITEEMP